MCDFDVDTVHLEKGDVLVLRGSNVTRASEEMLARYLLDRGLDNLIVVLDGDTTLEKLSREDLERLWRGPANRGG